MPPFDAIRVSVRRGLLALFASTLFLAACGAEFDGDFDFVGAGAQSPLAATSVPFEAGTHGYRCFRTPALVKATNGHLLAFAGGRKGGCGDDTDADLVLRRSTDRGRTWEPLQVLDRGAGGDKNRVSLANPVVLDDGRVLVLYMWSRFVDHEDDRGCRRVYLMSSDDHGKTWSSRRNITSQVQRPCREDDAGNWIDPPAPGEWGWTGLGPVHGIVKSKSPHKGRIVVAGRHVAPDSKTYSHVVYSDDQGESWHIGGSLDLRSTESTVVELPNGDIMLNSRSGALGNRTVGVSSDGGESFAPAWVDESLIEPNGVQGSLLRYGQALLFSNPHHAKHRTRGTIQVSTDNGLSWEPKVTYTPSGEFSSYSDMARIKGGVGLLAEWGPSLKSTDKHREIRFLFVPKEDLGL